MADEKDPNIQTVTKQETTEVIGLDGKTAGPNSLAGIFDALEAGKEEGRSNKEVLAEVRTKPAEKPAPKEEKKEVEAKVETDLDKKLKEEKVETKEETDPRKALQAAFEKKQEQKDGKAEDKAEKSDDDVPEDELKPLPHDKPKTVKRIQALLKKIETVSTEATRTKAERDEKATKLAELEEKLSKVQTSNPETDEKIKKQLDELAMYRRRYELDADPDVKTKFDGRVSAAEEAIVATLKRRNAGEPLLNLIKDEGGWSSFANSTRLVTIPDGEGGTKQVTSAELAELVLAQLPLGDRNAVQAAMMEQVTTKRDKERYFKEEQAKANEFFKKRDEESAKASEAHQKQVQEAGKLIEDWRKKVEASDWVKDKEVPATATAQEKAQIAEFNRYNAQIRSYVKKAVETKDLNGMLEIIEDSAKYYNERRVAAALADENTRLKAQIKAKEDELVKFKNAGRSVTRQGSISVAPVQESQRSKAPQTLEDAFEAITQGKNLRETLVSSDE